MPNPANPAQAALPARLVQIAYRVDDLTTFLDLVFVAIVALTILFGPDSTPVGNIYLFKQLTYNPEKDFAPIAPMVWNTFVLVINPQRTQANTVGELTAQIKSKGGKAHYGITNSGAQLMGEL